jgi:hypothetical protein
LISIFGFVTALSAYDVIEGQNPAISSLSFGKKLAAFAAWTYIGRVFSWKSEIREESYS